MSSATSTDAAQPAGVSANRKDRSQQGLQPWQFFVLAALACATAVTFIVRGQGPAAVILLTLLMGAAALAGLAALRAVLPLVGAYDERQPITDQRARVTLERDKMLTLRAIKELEFDRAMGKMSEEDFKEMSGRLRARAGRLIRALDAGAGYRDRIERDLAKRLGEKGQATADASRVCARCATVNESDAKFCKNCGEKF
jgi:hypothetical protein